MVDGEQAMTQMTLHHLTTTLDPVRINRAMGQHSKAGVLASGPVPSVVLLQGGRPIAQAIEAIRQAAAAGGEEEVVDGIMVARAAHDLHLGRRASQARGMRVPASARLRAGKMWFADVSLVKNDTPACTLRIHFYCT